ncbi:VanZ family protein [Paucihalobacter ruber]|uniref:VanZ family protein n=1 Tax=Paucihalobacter ruber TaxID=2567861 RepID=A0A506PQR3_9FLAO|nr:VanZ family protein [Paucihalobacter ruber]TPV35848.1 VanZ family protein [Paucihalobacter ruber]
MITKLLSTLSRFALPLLICYVVLITVLSLVSLHNLPEINTGHDDKIFHALAYTVFVIVLFNFLQKANVKSAVWIAMIVSFAYGTVLEVLQKVLNTDRTFDIFDIFANGIGVIIGYFLVRGLYKLKLN